MPGSRITFTRCIPLLGMVGLIFAVSHLPGDSLNFRSITHADKLAHITVYAILSLSFLFAVGGTAPGRSPLRFALMAMVFAIVHGIFDELHQSFIPGRTASFGDLVADTAGSAVAVISWVVYHKRQMSRPLPKI